MLTEVEKDGCYHILKKLSVEEIDSLKDTVTRKQIFTSGIPETITAIVTYSESAAELLKRKKIRRDILFQYLADNKVTVSVAAEKHQLIAKILSFWGSSCEKDLSPPSGYRSYGDERSTSPPVVHESRNNINVVYPTQPRNTEVLQPVQDENFELAKQFIKWFYKMLNSHNPSLQDCPDGPFGPQHFWSDCRLDMKFSVRGEVNMECFEGSNMVAQRFLALVKEERLLFNPNLKPDGIRVKTDAHGLVIIMTCGTIHRTSDCLGVFEQLFGLVSDPTLDNNWKVKWSQLDIKSSQHPTMPKLDFSEPMLAIGHTR